MKIALVFSLLGFASAVSANPDGGKMWQACGADVDRFCQGSPNPGMCLHEHWDELSPGCRQAKERMRKWKGGKGEGESQDNKGQNPERKKAGPAGAQACAEDKKRLCPDAVDPAACFREFAHQLSPDCREYKEKMKAGEGDRSGELAQEACARDLKMFCAEAAAPHECLESKFDSLSQDCRGLMAKKMESKKKRKPKIDRVDNEQE